MFLICSTGICVTDEKGDATMSKSMNTAEAGCGAPAEGPGESGMAVPAAAEAAALALSGSRSVMFADRLAEQVALCQPLPADEDGRSYRAAAAMEALKALAPRSALEGMLAGQMVAAHNVALELVRQAFRDGQQVATIEAFLRQGLRAMALFARQQEAMTRQRGRQRQSLRIEHEQVAGDGRVSVRAEEERVQ
jgi:hypothetical protein